MQFDGLSKRLEGIEDASKKGYPIQNLYRLMYLKDIWYEAYANIYSNSGAITKGVNENTLDGFSTIRVETIIKALTEEKYRFTPAKRVYIPKRTGLKKRPLGLPAGDDKLVQEVIRIILERIYEPIFSDNSHGFRPNRSCHTAFQQIQRVWTGTKWFIEFDIKSFFDNMDHQIMIQLLQKKIADKRFIKLIKHMLESGYLEDWQYHPTYSGVPQGGVVSPILSNIYLHELDSKMKELEINFTKGKKRRINPEYQRLVNQKRRIRKTIDKVGPKPELVERLNQLDSLSKALPSTDPYDECYRRLRYCRYADDFIAGIIGTQDSAKEIMERVRTFLEKALKLQLADDKTSIRSGNEGVQFLSYHISTYSANKVVRTKIHGRYVSKRTISNRITLKVPEGKAQDFCQKYGYGDWQAMKPTHRPKLSNASDAEILSTYNAELSGLANYYCLASDVKQKLKKLEYMVHYSLFKILANKHKTRIKQILKRLKQGNEFVHEYMVKGQVRKLKVFKLKHMDRKPKVWNVDCLPSTLHLISPRSELVKRLNYKECEYCGRSNLPLESHHVRKLKDLKKKPNKKKWEQVMIARNRKTLVICVECHDLLHAGKLSDSRYQDNA
jgi:RNA-directed DNA polymerase